MAEQDISARSPNPDCLDKLPRASLDARRSFDARRSLDVRRSRAPARSSMQEHRTNSTNDMTHEEGFEDVGLSDEPKPVPVKKRGLFARFGDSNNTDASEERPASTHHHFNFTGRKRAQSNGQGSELKSMPGPTTTSTQAEVPIGTR